MPPEDNAFDARTVHRLGMAGLGRNVGYGANKVFTAPMLEALKVSQPLIGYILGLEGLLGIIMNPLTGWLSDRTTKPGFRRKVYVVTCLPGAAIAWLLFYFLHSQAAAMTVIVVFYLFQQSSTSTYQAWMPEIVPSSKWGLASGYLNLWWLVGNLIAFLVVPMVWKLNHMGAFVLTSSLMVLSGLITGFGVREPIIATRNTGKQTVGAPEEATSAQTSDFTRLRRMNYRIFLNRNLVMYFIVHLLSWLSFEALASFFTLFIIHVAGGSQLDSALAMSVFTLTGIISAFFIGKLYQRVSPKLLLALALGLYGVFSLTGLIVHQMTIVFIVVGVEGIFWSTNLTVSFALASELLHQAVNHDEQEKLLRGGLFGINTLMESAGLLVAAPLAGAVISWSGGNYAGIFLVSAVASLVAILFVLLIRREPVGS